MEGLLRLRSGKAWQRTMVGAPAQVVECALLCRRWELSPERPWRRSAAAASFGLW